MGNLVRQLSVYENQIMKANYINGKIVEHLNLTDIWTEGAISRVMVAS